jgi:hypothetical protein
MAKQRGTIFQRGQTLGGRGQPREGFDGKAASEHDLRKQRLRKCSRR